MILVYCYRWDFSFRVLVVILIYLADLHLDSRYNLCKFTPTMGRPEVDNMKSCKPRWINHGSCKELLDSSYVKWRHIEKDIICNTISMSINPRVLSSSLKLSNSSMHRLLNGVIDIYLNITFCFLSFHIGNI